MKIEFFLNPLDVASLLNEGVNNFLDYGYVPEGHLKVIDSANGHSFLTADEAPIFLYLILMRDLLHKIEVGQQKTLSLETDYSLKVTRASDSVIYLQAAGEQAHTLDYVGFKDAIDEVASNVYEYIQTTLPNCLSKDHDYFDELVESKA